MARSSLIVCAWAALLTSGGSAAWSQQSGPPKAAADETKESAWLHDVFFREMSEYDFSLDAKKPQKLVMRREPVLRYPTPADFWGEIYLWTDRGRPAVVGCVFGGKRPNSPRRIYHEFHSLAPKPLVAGGGATGWQPEEAGIQFQSLPGMEEPDKDKGRRLAQMRDIAGRFSAGMIWVNTKVDLKLLPKPLYRYELADGDSSVVDGALFAFAAITSNDPEVLLVIEARRKEDKVGWHYAPVRFTNRHAWLDYKGEEVWQDEANVVGVFDGVTTKRYGVFLVKTIPEAVDEN